MLAAVLGEPILMFCKSRCRFVLLRVKAALKAECVCEQPTVPTTRATTLSLPVQPVSLHES